MRNNTTIKCMDSMNQKMKFREIEDAWKEKEEACKKKKKACKEWEALLVSMSKIRNKIYHTYLSEADKEDLNSDLQLLQMKKNKLAIALGY